MRRLRKKHALHGFGKIFIFLKKRFVHKKIVHLERVFSYFSFSFDVSFLYASFFAAGIEDLIADPVSRPFTKDEFDWIFEREEALRVELYV